MKKIRKPIEYEEIAFLRESNNIENEWDDLSLQQAIHAWDYVRSEKELTPSVVRKTHKILMLHQGLQPNEKGYFRKVPVWVGGREGKPFYAIEGLIENWCKSVNETLTGARDIKNDIERAKHHHIAYETIHPFIDGNGRTGRIFYNWERLKLGLPIDIILEKEKWKYYDLFPKE